MIFRSNTPLSPSVEVSISGVPFDYLSLQQVELDLSEDKHDLIRLRVTGMPPKTVVSFVNAPVRVSWSQGNQGHEFRGYVAYVLPTYQSNVGLINNSPLQVTDVICMGASFVMKAKKNRLWEKVSLEAIVSKLALEYRFSYEIPQDNFRFFRLVQSGESDWEFLLRVVHDLGYSMTAHGTHIHVFNRMRAVTRNISYHRLLIPGRSSLSLEPNQILRFDGTVGYVTPEGNSNVDTLSVLDNAGKVTTLSRTSPTTRTGDALPNLFTDQLSGTSTSVDYARKTLASRGRHKFPFSAKIEATGTPGVLPGGLVLVDDFESQFDGLWYVTDICQTLTRDRHYSEISVLKDTTKGTISGAANARNINVPPSVLSGGAWRSSSQTGTTYA